jgi:hypothetical protein
MRKSLVLGLLALSFSRTLAAETAAPDKPVAAMTPAERAAIREAACQKALCRKTPHDISLRMPQDHFFKYATSNLPFVDADGVVTLYPGDRISVSVPAEGKPVLLAARDGDTAVDVAQPSVPVDASRLTFAFTQMDGQAGMMLVAGNIGAATLKYDGIIIYATPQGTKVAGTSLCPLMPSPKPGVEFSGFENWPQPAIMLVIRNIRMLPKGAPMSCN